VDCVHLLDKKKRKETAGNGNMIVVLYSMFACWFQPGLISQPIVFFSHNKPAPVRLISPKTNQRTGS